MISLGGSVEVCILLTGAEQHARIDGADAGGAFRIGIRLGNPLTQGIIVEDISLHASRPGALAQAGQLAICPGSGLVVVTGRTAHGVIGDAGTAEAGQLVVRITEGSGHRGAGDRAGSIVIRLHAG